MALTICSLASMSPRSMRLASSTSSLGGQQLDLADRAQVEAQRVEARLDRQVELRRLRLRPVGGRLVGLLVGASTPSAAITSMPCSTRWACSSRTWSSESSTSSSGRRSPRGQVAALWPSAIRSRSSSTRAKLTSASGISVTGAASSPSISSSRHQLPGLTAQWASDLPVCRDSPRGLATAGQRQPAGLVAGPDYRPDSVLSSMRWLRDDRPSSPLDAPTCRRARPRTAVSLSRVGVTGVEKIVRISAQRRRAALPRRARVLRRPQPAAGRRPHVALRGGRERGDRRGRARRGASRPRRSPPTSPSASASARAACAPRSRSRARYPETSRRRSRACTTQEIYTLFGTAVASERGHAHAVGVAGAGHDRLPVRPGAGRRPRPRAAASSTASPTTRSSASSRPSRSPPTTSAASARSTSAAPRAATTEIDARDAAAHRRGVDELGDLRADEALRRARGRREGAPPPALRRGLRARDGPPASSTRYPELDDDGFVLRPPGEPRDDPPAQRRRRALRPARRAPRRARLRRALAPPRDDARVAREPRAAPRARPRRRRRVRRASSMRRRSPKK